MGAFWSKTGNCSKNVLSKVWFARAIYHTPNGFCARVGACPCDSTPLPKGPYRPIMWQQLLSLFFHSFCDGHNALLVFLHPFLVKAPFLNFFHPPAPPHETSCSLPANYFLQPPLSEPYFYNRFFFFSFNLKLNINILLTLKFLSTRISPLPPSLLVRYKLILGVSWLG